ncbi:hypothetical protein ISN44_As07g023280 [Arabidopsis suecica]|uniref:Uncharacterized protein n=1 Tax=Arabidopsis suecica TaxID=45249 RepID=A0A8T2BTC8_ARASU|nr:hypothetical protein ISN44_As07g023280 [Arabidopsis suecica]
MADKDVRQSTQIREYDEVLSLLTWRLFSPVMHIYILCSLLLMAAWKFDNGFTHEGLLLAPLYLLATIGEVAAKILNDKEAGYVTRSYSHLLGGYTILMLSFDCGMFPLVIGLLWALFVSILFPYNYDLVA